MPSQHREDLDLVPAPLGITRWGSILQHFTQAWTRSKGPPISTTLADQSKQYPERASTNKINFRLYSHMVKARRLTAYPAAVTERRKEDFQFGPSRSGPVGLTRRSSLQLRLLNYRRRCHTFKPPSFPRIFAVLIHRIPSASCSTTTVGYLAAPAPCLYLPISHSTPVPRSLRLGLAPGKLLTMRSLKLSRQL